MDIVVHMVVWEKDQEGSEDVPRDIMEYFAKEVPKEFMFKDRTYWVEGFRILGGEQDRMIEVGNPPKHLNKLLH